MVRRASGRKLFLIVFLIGFLISLTAAGVMRIAQQRLLLQTTFVSYTVSSGEARWEGDWEFSALGADPSERGSQIGADRVSIPFSGTDLALQVRRGDYRGYLYVTVDGLPANLLPRDERGAYLVLTSPDGAPQVTTIPVAGGLDDEPHIALIVAERGWDQWPLVGWRVGRAPDTTAYRRALTALAASCLVCAAGLVIGGWRWREMRWREAARWPESEMRFLTGGRAALWMGALAGVAAVFYVSPWLPLALASGVALAILVFLRFDLGLAFAAAMAPFYFYPRQLLGRSFSMAEIVTLMCGCAWMASRFARGAAEIRRCGWRSVLANAPSRALGVLLELDVLDWAVIAFVAVAAWSTIAAEFRHVALREWRVLFFEPALFYLLLRAARLDRWAVWRTVDGFVAGALAVACIGLAQYAMGVGLITAEGGFPRLRSVYGSPNSVGLYLGRALPVLIAVSLFGADRRRRIVYGLSALPVGAAVVLSFSKGALVLGVPLSLAALGLLAGGPWLWSALGTVVTAALAVFALLRTPRFASLLDPSSGTVFFRLHLWRAAWTMFREHPWLGVGPDNFLYHYRSRYILPAAWQEPNLSQAHNILLDYATRLGLAGLASGAWLQIAFWRLALPLRRLADRDLRALALGLMASMVNFLAHGLVDASYFLIDLAFAFFLTLGVVQWISRSKTDEKT